MNIKEKARLFAINVHMGQVRKNEPDKPMVMHPIGVGELLEKLGYDDNVVAAGYLHDVVEDTRYTIEDIQKEFGEDIADLVAGATESDKSLPWAERKQKTVNEMKEYPLRKRVIIGADKINNLKDLYLKFMKTGVRDFSKFKAGEYAQYWYYKNVYQSLIEGFNGDEYPIFKMYFLLLKAIFEYEIVPELNNIIFDKDEIFDEIYYEDVIFKDNRQYYEELRKLHFAKLELYDLKKMAPSKKPFVIEFCGTPRTGKTTIINNLHDFFKKGGFSIKLIEEFTTSKYYKEEVKPSLSKVSTYEKNKVIFDKVCEQLQEACKLDYDIILIDRSINDRQVWNRRMYDSYFADIDQYTELKDKYFSLSNLVDCLLVTYAEPLVALKRDYNSSLSLEQRSFLNINNISSYNKSLLALQGIFEINIRTCIMVDTSTLQLNDYLTKIASDIMKAMRKMYIENFAQKHGFEWKAY